MTYGFETGSPSQPIHSKAPGYIARKTFSGCDHFFTDKNSIAWPAIEWPNCRVQPFQFFLLQVNPVTGEEYPVFLGVLSNETGSVWWWIMGGEETKKPETCGGIARISICFQVICVFLGFERKSSAIYLYRSSQLYCGRLIVMNCCFKKWCEKFWRKLLKHKVITYPKFLTSDLLICQSQSQRTT